MQKFYKIYPIPLISLIIGKAAFTYLKNLGEKVLVPTCTFLIEGWEEPILVDVGGS